MRTLSQFTDTRNRKDGAAVARAVIRQALRDFLLGSMGERLSAGAWLRHGRCAEICDEARIDYGVMTTVIARAVVMSELDRRRLWEEIKVEFNGRSR